MFTEYIMSVVNALLDAVAALLFTLVTRDRCINYIETIYTGGAIRVEAPTPAILPVM